MVDIDLEKFFDNVPQDKLMSYVGRVIHGGDTESLIRKYLKAGVMTKGTYTEWIERKLVLKVNATKIKVTPPSKLKYLGFGFWKDKTE